MQALLKGRDDLTNIWVIKPTDALVREAAETGADGMARPMKRTLSALHLVSLGVGGETVKTLVARTFGKLGVRRRAEAVAAAHDQGLL